MKKLSVLCLLVGLFTGCANKAPAQKTLGVILIDLTNQFFVDMMEGGNQAAKDYNIKVVWKSSDGSIEKQIALMENFIEQRVDCILVNPIDSDALKDVIKKASAAGIPTVTMAGQVDVPSNYTTVYNDLENTKIIANIIAKSVKESGKVALLYGNKGNLVSDLRQKGFQEAMKAYPNITLIEQPMNWDPATGLKAMQDILASNPDLRAVHCVSDAVTLAAYQAIKDAGKQDQVLVTSFDGNPDSCDAVERGEFLLTVLTGAKRAGYWNIQVGADLVSGKVSTTNILNMATHFVLTSEGSKKVRDLGFTELSMILPADAKAMANKYTDFEPKK